MRRGEIWTVSGATDYAGKPRPSIILQDETFGEMDSITICGFTSVLTQASYLRVRIQPSPENGLRDVCDVMVDKITTVPRSKLGRPIGKLADDDMERLVSSMIIFFRLAPPPAEPDV